jgi:hypothetical protein
MRKKWKKESDEVKGGSLREEWRFKLGLVNYPNDISEGRLYG